MAEEYYPEPDDQMPMSDDESSPEAEDKSDGETTALLPKSVFGGNDFKPGDKVTLEVSHVYEDEVEVKQVSDTGGSDSTKAPMSANDEIDMLAVKGEE